MAATPAPGGRSPAFDAHLHIVDPRFPLVANQGYLPEPFTVADYRARTAHLGIVGGAVVSGSFQAHDQTYLRDALRRLGPGFVGVTQLPASAGDAVLLELAAAGVRGLRLNLHRGGREDLAGLVGRARRAAELAGWHTELYLDARDLPELLPSIAGLPRLCVDHLGLSREGLPHLLALVESGARVKATGFGRGDLDVPAALSAVSAVDPGALMFGTDLPSTRAPRPFADADIDLVLESLGPELGRRVLCDNAAAFYRVETQAGRSAGHN
jgi:predicted TIM-barrel fold metal-dependent hydrolase